MQPHLRINKGDISRYCLIVGDPGRAVKITNFLKKAKKISENRGFLVYNGEFDGVPVSVISTGIGIPSTAIILEEIIKCGAEVIIRAGSGGILKREMSTGDLIISTGVCKEEKSSEAYASSGFAAVPDYDVLNALIQSAEALGKKYYYGLTMCSDGFYAEKHRKTMMEWSKNNVIGSDMESSILFTLSSLRGVKAGFIFYGGLNIFRKETYKDILKQEAPRTAGEKNAILVGLTALKKMDKVNEWQRRKK